MPKIFFDMEDYDKLMKQASIVCKPLYHRLSELKFSKATIFTDSDIHSMNCGVELLKQKITNPDKAPYDEIINKLKRT